GGVDGGVPPRPRAIEGEPAREPHDERRQERPEPPVGQRARDRQEPVRRAAGGSIRQRCADGEEQREGGPAAPYREPHPQLRAKGASVTQASPAHTRTLYTTVRLLRLFLELRDPLLR